MQRALGDCLMAHPTATKVCGLSKALVDRLMANRIACQLAELEYVSYVGLFDELSVEHLVAEVKPDVLAIRMIFRGGR